MYHRAKRSLPPQTETFEAGMRETGRWGASKSKVELARLGLEDLRMGKVWD